VTCSDQQKKILCLLSEGKRHKEIADSLKLSPRTVDTYIARLRYKFGAKSTVELIVLWVSVKSRPLDPVRKRTGR
jgi:DNA-binding CsgD family transcriptional regulator